MAATSSTASTAEAPHSNKLEDQAATAALYVTNPAKRKSHPLLDDNGRLSSAGAATSLKHAQPQDLPSFPSSGLKLSSAGAAASLATNNTKSIEHWKPGSLPAAEKAAFLAKDYQADRLWEPEMSSAGSKAALLAHRDGGNVTVWQPQESDNGLSAAGQALRKKNLSPTVDRSIDADASHRALLAATGAVSSSRKRADSAPLRPSRTDTPTSNALLAATKSHQAHRPNTPSFDGGNRAQEASRIHNIARNNVAREMYSSHPPVSAEVEEKNRQDTLRASAVAMAQKMYAIQQHAIDEAKGVQRSDSHSAANHVHQRRSSVASSITSDEIITSPRYTNLEDAARKLAQERLAKMQDEHSEYRSYYGAPTPSRSKLSIHNRLRRRASSDGSLDKVDEEQSKKIRSQMSLFQNKVAEVDKQKQQKDRNALLAAAQRNVTANMNTMDKRVFNETGKASPAMMQEWEAKARERAQASSNARLENYGKVHIGGGKYLDQSAVDAVAQSRIQPTLDDINSKAEEKRARDEEIKLEQEQKKKHSETEKARALELKAEQKRAKEEEKNEERNRKAAEEAARKEEKKALKDDKRKSKDNKGKTLGTVFGLGGTKDEPQAKNGNEATEQLAAAPSGNTEENTVAAPRAPGPDEHIEVDSIYKSSVVPTNNEPSTSKSPALKAADGAGDDPNTSPKAGDSKVKSWLKSRFRRSTNPSAEDEAGDKSFVGGAALTGANVETAAAKSNASTSEGKPGEDSMREVALAGKSEPEDMYGASDEEASEEEQAVSPPVEPVPVIARPSTPSISSLSSSDLEEDATQSAAQPGDAAAPEQERGRRGFRDRLLGLGLNKKAPKESGKSQGDDEDDNSSSKKDEDDFEEARDTFDEGPTLAPPPKLTPIASIGPSKGSAGTASPARDSRFSEEF